LDSNGNIYVADYNNNRVIEFNKGVASAGAAHQVWGQGGSFGLSRCDASGVNATSLCNPAGVAVDSSNNLYIADDGNGRALKFTETANPPTNVTANVALGQASLIVQGCNTPGLSSTSECSPAGIAIDSSSDVFVVDSGNNRVIKYTSPVSTGQAAELASPWPI
jgi:hypothetical protein